MTKGGSVTDQSDFVNTLNTLAEGLTLSSIVTPQQTFLNANIQHVSQLRSADAGAGLMKFEISFIEIRTTVTVTFNSTKTDSGASPVDDGAVQVTPLTTDEITVVQSNIETLIPPQEIE